MSGGCIPAKVQRRHLIMSDTFDTSHSNTPNEQKITMFEVTERMANVGIKQFFLNKGDFEISFIDGRKCCVSFSAKTVSISAHIKNIRKKLKETLDKKFDPDTLKLALNDIEDELIKHRDEIFGFSSNGNSQGNIQPDDKSKRKFIEDVINLRNQFKESNLSYQQWQSLVAEKYENLRKVITKHYPEAWTLMEFCLSVKSIQNVSDFTLPFMGVILAVPSSMKTMIIELFRKYPGSFYSDSFTPNSLISHNSALSEEQLQQVDMLPKMKDKLVLTPELAPIFTAKDDDLQKALGIITRILDGHGLENDSGAHGHRRYDDIMFVWLGAAVEIPPKVWKMLGTLGHKIYFLRPQLRKKTPEELKKIAKTNDYSSNNREIEGALLDYLKTIDVVTAIVNTQNGTVKVKWNENIEDEQDIALEYIAQVANLLAPLRGTVYLSESRSINYRPNNSNNTNNKSTHPQSQEQSNQQEESNINNNNFIQFDGQDYDTDFPTIEDPSRATILLRNLAIGHAVSQGRDFINLKDTPIVVEVALSTAPVRRVKVLDLLLKHSGELTTSQITNELRVSQPVARRTIREFHALGIADLSAIAGYNNAEHKITLKSEFDWFKTKEFEKLREGFIPSLDDDAMRKDEKGNADEIASTDGQQQQAYGRVTSHTLKSKIPPETHEKNSNNDNLNEIEFQDNEGILNGTNSDEKNNVPLWGVNPFQLVTQSHGHTQSLLEESEDIAIGENLAFDEILTVIKEANGFHIAVNSAIQSAYNRSKSVRAHIGDKLTQRENKRVKNLCLKIIRHENIEVVKHKPQLIVKWCNDERLGQRSTDASSPNGGATAD